MFKRFFGKTVGGPASYGDLIANPAISRPRSLQLLFPTAFRLDELTLISSFRQFHESMAGVKCEFDELLNAEGKIFGMIGWGHHVVRCVGFDLPMPAECVESCVAPSHYPEDMKARAREHTAHLLLYYAGYESSPVEQFVALAATAAVFAKLGAIIVLNESARTSFPAAALWGTDPDVDRLEQLRTFPLPLLFCGFVKYCVIDIPGVWMRTYGAPHLGLPDFLAQTEGQHEGERFLEMFEHVFRYLLESGAKLAAGHTLQIGTEEYIRLREPSEDERGGASDSELFVVEMIGPGEINQ